MTGGDISEQRPGKPDRVDSEMAVEPAILGRDDGLRQVGRHFLQSQRLTKEVAVSSEQASICRQYRDTRAALGAGQLARVGKCESEITDDCTSSDQSPQTQQHAKFCSARKRPIGWPTLP